MYVLRLRARGLGCRPTGAAVTTTTDSDEARSTNFCDGASAEMHAHINMLLGIFHPPWPTASTARMTRLSTVRITAEIPAHAETPAYPAVVHYTDKIVGRHGEYVGFATDPTLDDAKPPLTDARVARTVNLHDARTAQTHQLDKHQFTIARHGFELRRWPTRVCDFDDSSMVLRDYVPEVEALVSAAMQANGARGIRAVVVWDLCLRCSELASEFQEVAVAAADASTAGHALDQLAPVPLAHVDFYSKSDVYRRLRQRWSRSTDTLSTYMQADFAAKGLSRDADMPRCLASRVVSVNVWRSIDAKSPVRRCPLALCDPTSLAAPADELVPFEIHCPDVRFAEAHVLADGSAAHRWYVYPEMTSDECVIFVSGDTAARWPAPPHSSVDDPRTSPTDPPRKSIEARVFVLFEEEEEGTSEAV